MYGHFWEDGFCFLVHTELFLLRSEGSCDYVDSLLSMEYLPNITVIERAPVNHALVSGKEDIKCEYDDNRILFKYFKYLILNIFH